MEISAIICTHNRSQFLKSALVSLRNQSVDKQGFEIIVVDNASKDDTRQVVEEFTEQAGNLRYVHEPRLGLSHARNTGLHHANGEIVAFLDDDAEANHDWLFQIMNTFGQVTPTPSCVGGRVLPNWEAQKPKWLPDSLMTYLSIIDWGEVPRWLFFPKEFPAGANIAFLKQDLLEQGGFNASLGRRGNRLLGNEEIILLHKLTRAGKGIYYQPAARVRHFVPRTRLTRRFLLRRAYWQGVSNAILWNILDNFKEDHKARNLKLALQGFFSNLYKALKVFEQQEQTKYLVNTACWLGTAAKEVGFILHR